MTALDVEIIPYSDGTTEFEGYFSVPSGDEALPCILLCHDWSGRLEHIDRQADALAALGYAVLAIDVYGIGQRGTVEGDNSHLLAPLMADRPALAKRLIAALDTAADHRRADATRMAAVGYCLGGMCALDLARTGDPRLKAAVSIHGGLTPTDERGKMSASLLILHGWEDPVALPDAVLALIDEMTASGADWQLHVYGHVMHAFTAPGMNMPERGMAYNADADRRSRQALVNFLDEQLSRNLGGLA